MGKGVFCILLLSACGVVAQAQSPAKNYILGRQMLDANGSQACGKQIESISDKAGSLLYDGSFTNKYYKYGARK